MPKTETEKPKCLLCKKTLVPIFNKRKNGTTCRQDWAGRKYHKSCYILKINTEIYDHTYNDD